MSAGRGTPRTPPFEGALPDTSRVFNAAVLPSFAILTPVSNAKWSFRWGIGRTNALALDAAGKVYDDDNALTSFPIPLGAKRGALDITYTGQVAVGGQVGITMRWGSNQRELSHMIDVATLSYPASDNPEVTTTHFVERISPIPVTDNTARNFLLPFWVPPIGALDDGTLNLQSPYIPIEFFVQEVGGAADGTSTLRINQLIADNLAEAQPVARL